MKKLVIAHRGASVLARENTLEAFQKAIDLRADMIEFDVRRTQDRHYVIHHDPHIAGKPLNEMTLREVREIARTLDFHVPELEEVLALTRGKIGLDIELKEEGYEQRNHPARRPEPGRGGFHRELLPRGLPCKGQAVPCRGENRLDLQ